MFATRGKLTGKLANSKRIWRLSPDRIGLPVYVSVTFAWFDRHVSLSQPGRSTNVETVNSSPAPFGKNSANLLRTPKTAKSFGGRS